MGKVSTETRVVCKSDVCSLWTLLTDTERMNRAIGLHSVELRPLRDAGAARYLATTRLGGFRVTYEERPYEWSYLRYFRIYRRMRNGPVRDLEMAHAFSTTPSGGTEVRMRLTLEPRLGMLAPIVRFNSRKSLRRFAEEIRRLDEGLAQKRPVEIGAAARSPVARDALERAARALRAIPGVDAGLADRLIEHVASGADFDLSRLRPYELAEKWGAPRRAALSTCLYAVKAGLLDLRWDLVCPSCRTSSSSVASLAEIEGHGACQLCDIQFGLDLDETVEATFTPAAAVRRVDQGPYCIGGPARTPHVLAQIVLPGGGAIAQLDAPTEAGAFRLFVRGGRSLRLDVRPEAAAELRLVDGDGDIGWPQRAEVAPGGAVALVRPDAGDRHVKLERLAWLDTSATARDVTALPVFRREFSSDVLRPKVSLKVSRVALLFSDLTASTRLYTRAGDAAAFRLVQDHFEVVLEIIQRHGGTLVKTIGDAVMAAFTDELEAFVAARAVLEAFAHFRREVPLRQETDIKLGVYAGPCYVVTANGILDYFGQTVNIAARLQAQADSAELVVEERLADEAVARGLTGEAQVVERYPAELKGLDRPIPVARLRVPR